MSRTCVIPNAQIMIHWPEGKWNPVSRIMTVEARDLPDGRRASKVVYDFSSTCSNWPAGVVPQVCRATVKLEGRWVSCAAVGFTKLDAQKQAMARVRRAAWRHLKTLKPVVTISTNGCHWRDLKGWNGLTMHGSGPTIHAAYTAMCFNRINAARIMQEMVEQADEVAAAKAMNEQCPPTPPKRWSFWDWFRK